MLTGALAEQPRFLSKALLNKRGSFQRRQNAIEGEMKEGRAGGGGSKLFCCFVVRFHIISLRAETCAPLVCRVQRLHVRARSREHLLHVQTDVLRLLPLPRWRSEPPPPPPAPSPRLSFRKHLFLRRHVGDTCVPAAARRNRVTSRKWSPLRADNAQGDPPAPASAQEANMLAS